MSYLRQCQTTLPWRHGTRRWWWRSSSAAAWGRGCTFSPSAEPSRRVNFWPCWCPFGGAYKLIDVPMRNCIISGINKVYILTQFNSASLNQYLSWMYNFSNGIAFGYGFVEVLTATQTPGSEGKRWFQGTDVMQHAVVLRMPKPKTSMMC